MRLSHNIASLNIYKQYSKALNNQSKALSKISSGLKVDSAKDNPEVMSKSEKINLQIKGLQMASKNMQDGTSMLQTAEGGLDNMTSVLQRIRDLTLQAGNGTNTPEDASQIQIEINQLVDGYNEIANDTQFNGINILSGGNSFGTTPVAERKIMIGANSGEEISMPYYNLTSNNVGNGTNTLTDLKSSMSVASGNASGALGVIDSVVTSILSVRSKYGALENRVISTDDGVGEFSQIMDGANSKLVDADIAKEMMEFSKDGILSQAGIAMMAQSNKFPQEILNILQNVKR